MKQDNPIVRLSPEDLTYITRVSNKFHTFNKETNAKSKKHDKKMSEFELHYIGIMGEYATATYFGVDINTHTFRGGDNGIDIVVKGLPIHIKTTNRQSNQLLILDNMDCFTTDVGILAAILSPVRVELCGVVRKDYFKKHHSIQNLGYGDRLVLPARLMAHVDKLKGDDE